MTCTNSQLPQSTNLNFTYHEADMVEVYHLVSEPSLLHSSLQLGFVIFLLIAMFTVYWGESGDMVDIHECHEYEEKGGAHRNGGLTTCTGDKLS